MPETIAIFVFAVVIIAKGIKVVSQADMLVIERLGKYNRVLTGGLKEGEKVKIASIQKGKAILER
ncbi:hypothetical protein [Sulfurimonas indica]|uniref:hypothetical protein n=1 Tax=Sulfurimonas TaxID=202746 RepID=UPI0012654A6E|nr:hypothetical protein [Sulfurimonas indica]